MPGTVAAQHWRMVKCVHPSPVTTDPFTDIAPIAAFASRCNTAGLSAAGREDPMHETPWCGGSRAAWLSRGKADVEHDRFGTAYPPGTILDKREARSQVAAHAPTAAAVIGALNIHGTLTAEQVAAFVGMEAADLLASGVLQALWSMSALEVGRVHSGWHAYWERTLWTIDDKEVIATHVLPLLSQTEELALTAGQGIHAAQGHDRHAVLDAELALRIAEYTPVGTVLGERLSDLERLFDHPTTRRRGDLTAVRADGLRIVLEVVAHDNQEFSAKVDFLAQQLAARGRWHGTTMVVFVVAADPGSDASRSRGLAGRVAAAIADAREKYAFGWRDDCRMGMVSWQDWFPAAGELSQAFASLTVRFPGAGSTQGSVLDPEVVTCARPYDLDYLAVIQNASLLAQTPAWLRAPAQAREVLHRMGLPRLRDLPSPPLAKPKRARLLSRRRGAAGRPKLPPRLLGVPGERRDRRAKTAIPAPPHSPPAQPSSQPVVRRGTRPPDGPAAHGRTTPA
jgi:hypothetical protein